MRPQLASPQDPFHNAKHYCSNDDPMPSYAAREEGDSSCVRVYIFCGQRRTDFVECRIAKSSNIYVAKIDGYPCHLQLFIVEKKPVWGDPAEFVCLISAYLCMNKSHPGIHISLMDKCTAMFKTYECGKFFNESPTWRQALLE